MGGSRVGPPHSREGEVVVEPVRRVGQRPLVEVEDREQSSSRGAGGHAEIAPSLDEGLEVEETSSYGEAQRRPCTARMV